MRFAFAANAGGVDEAEAASVVLEDFVDGVARGAGYGRDDGAVGRGERVQQRGLADVGVTDDGDFGFVGRIVVGRWWLRVRRFGFVWEGREGIQVLSAARTRRLLACGRDGCATFFLLLF